MDQIVIICHSRISVYDFCQRISLPVRMEGSVVAFSHVLLLLVKIVDCRYLGVEENLVRTNDIDLKYI